ncbi:MAG: tetratricopeptide repeat protein [Terriglobales bacterium]
MRFKRSAASLLLVASLLSFSVACTRDPKVRKQRYMTSGDNYMKQEKYREAMIEYANAVKIDGNDPAAHYALAKSYMKQQTWNGAYAELLKTVTIDPANLQAQLDLGNLLLAAGQPDDATKRASLVLEKDPKNASAYALMANIAGSQKNFAESLKQMQKAIELEPANDQLYLNIAVFQLNNKDTASAESSIKKAISLKSTESAHEMLGGIYAQQQRWPDAEQEFKAAVAAAPKSIAARLRLASLYLAEQKPEAAEQVVAQTKKDLGKDAQSYTVLADFYLGRGQVDKALAEFASVSQEHPKDLAIRKRYIEVLLLTNHDSDAQKLIDEILKKDPNDLEGLIFRASLQLKQGSPASAIQGLQLATKTDATNAFAHYMLGQAYRANGETERALPELKEAVRLNPRLLLAQRALAELATARGDLDTLASAADAMIDNAPYSPDGYVNRALVEFNRKDPQKAETDLQKAIQIAPTNPAGYIHLALFRQSEKKGPEAEKLLEQALTVAPSSADALRPLVAYYLSQKQPDKALARVKAQIQKSPNTSAFYVMEGTLQAGAKDYAGAQVALRKAIELDSNNMEAYAVLGQVQLASGSLDDAVKSWNIWMQKNPKDIRPYIMISSLEQTRNNWQKAQEMLQKAMAIDPNNAIAANNLAYIMLEHGGDPDVALTLAQTARRGAPESPNVADTLGYAYYKKGIYSASIGMFEEAAKKQPENANVLYHLGFAYQKAKDNAKARQTLEKALKMAPNAADAASARHVLQQIG